MAQQYRVTLTGWQYGELQDGTTLTHGTEMSTYIIVLRVPRTKRVTCLHESDADKIREWPTRKAAETFAKQSTLCQAWGYQVIEVGMWT